MNRLLEFQGGDPALRRKLNELVQAVNMLIQGRGDEVFIAIRNNPGGGQTTSLNIDRVIERIPKNHGGGDLPVGQYQYTILQMVSQNQAGYDFARAHPMVG